MAKTAARPRTRKARPGKGVHSETRIPQAQALLRIHQDFASLRGDIARDRRQTKADADALERRVTVLEQSDQHHRKGYVELETQLKNLSASVDAIHTLMRGLSERVREAVPAVDMGPVLDALRRIEDRLLA